MRSAFGVAFQVVRPGPQGGCLKAVPRLGRIADGWTCEFARAALLEKGCVQAVVARRQRLLASQGQGPTCKKTLDHTALAFVQSGLERC